MPGGGDDGHSEQRPAVELRPRVLESAAAARKRERAPLRNEDLLHLDVLAAGADHAHRVPGVDDPVVALRHYAEAPIHWGLAVVAVDRDREHVPVAIVHARGERPPPADDKAVFCNPTTSRGKRDGGGGTGPPRAAASRSRAAARARPRTSARARRASARTRARGASPLRS